MYKIANFCTRLHIVRIMFTFDEIHDKKSNIINKLFSMSVTECESYHGLDDKFFYKS